jgi:hypothetical protein
LARDIELKNRRQHLGENFENFTQGRFLQLALASTIIIEKMPTLIELISYNNLQNSLWVIINFTRLRAL